MSEPTIYATEPSQVRDHVKYAQGVIRGVSASENVAELFRQCWMMDEDTSVEIAIEILKAEQEEEAIKAGLKREKDPSVTTSVARLTSAKAVKPVKVPAKYPPAPCDVCGTVFTPARHGHISCSRRCRELSLHARRSGIDPSEMRSKLTAPRKCVVVGLKPISCEQCAIEFTPTAKHQKYCSFKCNRKATAQNQAGQVGMNRKCRECDTEFTIRDVNYLYHCSKECFRAYKNRLMHESKARKLGITYSEYLEKIGLTT